MCLFRASLSSCMFLLHLFLNPSINNRVNIARRFPIVLPDPARPNKLMIQKEGLDLLRRIKGAVAPVVVIGPYRSGEAVQEEYYTHQVDLALKALVFQLLESISLSSRRFQIGSTCTSPALRSGKSFLLNQLLGVSCGEGFGVGHTRKTAGRCKLDPGLKATCFQPSNLRVRSLLSI